MFTSKTMMRSTSALVLISAALLPAAALAQTATTGTATPPAETPADGEIVVTAQRRSENIQSVPLTIQAISGDALKDRGVQQVQDLQQLTPNVTIASPLGAGSAPAVNIRGIGLNDFNTNNPGPNGVYVDEFAISSPNAQGMSFFDIERVEVLKGPQGTLYGRNASGGALNITTVHPGDTLEANGRVSYGSFNTVNAEAGITVPLTPTLSGRVSGVYNYSDGFMYNHVYDRRENGTNMGGVRGQLSWQPTPGFDALLKVQYVRNVTRAPMYKFYGMLDPATFAPCTTSAVFANDCVDIYGYAGRKGYYEGDYNNGNDKLRATDFNTTLRLSYDLPAELNLVSVTGYNYNKRSHPEQTDAGPADILAIVFGAKSREFTQELRLSQDKGPLNWVLGLYYLHETIDQDQPLTLLTDIDEIYGPSSGDGLAQRAQTTNQQTTNAYAAFGQATYKPTDALSLIVGARYTRENKDFAQQRSILTQSGGEGNFGPPALDNFADSISEGNFSWRLGARYEFNPDVNIYASAATGYKAGGFNGGFLSADLVERARQLQPFKPEKVRSYELGLKSRLLDRLVTFNIAGFYNDYRDQQVSVLVPIDPFAIFALSNAKKSRSYGIDSDLTIRPNRELTLSATLGYLDSKILQFVPGIDPTNDYSGNRLSMAPKWSTTLSAAYKKQVGNYTISALYDASYRSKVFFDPSNNPLNVQSPYWLHNVRLGLGFDQDRVEVAGFVRNLTKTKYAIWNAALPDFGLVASTLGWPRVFGVELTVRR